MRNAEIVCWSCKTVQKATFARLMSHHLIRCENCEASVSLTEEQRQAMAPAAGPAFKPPLQTKVVDARR
ncbi:MAG: hypothetical protein Q7T73_14635 [Beijerinckiaceae bacterium]|nr:hypothetical protein [Beijerinckiaceae bacterium]